jgi:ABC-type glycerol-3-phosphate transport system permease component
VSEARPPFYVMGAGAGILAALAIPLYAEFAEPGLTPWNLFLILFLGGVAVAAFFLQRFFLRHAGEVGEARFDTRNKGDANG